MKKKILSLFLLLGVVFGLFVGCNTGTGDSSSPIQQIDYVSQVSLDMSSDTLKQEVTVKLFIDGDTTHFNVPKSINDLGVLKARYLAVNTPESTDKIEEWGKKASNFTKSKLQNATSIIIETDGTDWEIDSTGERYLVWVWYKAEGSDTYRNLNLELLQNGLAFGSKAGDTRYGDICTQAIYQAQQLKLDVFSGEKDPDYYYGSAVELDLKELRLDLEKEEPTYVGARVAFEATVSFYSSQGVYLESFDEETQMYYGIYAYYGYSFSGAKILAVGNRVRIVGNVQYYEAGDSYQVADLRYNNYDKTNAENVQLIEEAQDIAYTEKTIDEFSADVKVKTENEEGAVVENTYTYAQLALNTSITMKNLQVVKAYTTKTGNSAGAISLTCEVDGKEITVRTVVLKDENNNTITQDVFVGKTISVQGIIDYYKPEKADTGDYQIKVFAMKNIVIE